ncbi:hypothetical protein A6A06_27185 [Streptomyces sp. CB02923]|uniref:MFS transporter n=1 Tax=Streptomyces sp. CB02923 TaxID=1718985 RepID=UPI0009402851|nr:MFS transporter [Streptomyces sp. CB02923]OKH99237.1 hypothetical protein A6A06_27185 [Streptomyces sp. CB02923]
MPAEPRHRWLRWSGYSVLAACFLSGFFYRFAPATFAESLSSSLGTSAAQLGVLASWHFWVYTAAQIPAGVVVDRYGTRVSVAAGSLVTAAGAFAQATAQDLFQASMGPVLTGLGLSVVFVGVMKNNAVWFAPEHYGTITGLTMLLANVGSVLAGSPSALLLHHVSWRTIFGAAAAISLLLAVGVVLFVRNRPGQTGFLPPPAPSGGPSRSGTGLCEAVKRRDVWPVFWCTIGTNGTFYAFSGLWGVPVLTDGFHISNAQASVYTTLALAVYGVGALVIGLVSDRLGRRKPLLLASSVISLAGWLLLAFAPWRPGWSGLTLYMLVGLAAAQVTVSFATLKELVPGGIAATVLAVANTGVFAASAVIQPLFGWIVDLTLSGTAAGASHLHGYRVALLLPVAFSAIGLLGALRARETWCRPSGERSQAHPPKRLRGNPRPAEQGK